MTRLLGRFRYPRIIRSRSFHNDYNAALEEHTFRLTDGRIMGFAEYGSLKGIPTFFFHGSPGSRYDGIGLIDIAKKLNIRAICPDRPGHGLSTFQHNRKLVDYPHDISQLAKHLGVARYNVLGQSGGGPYAVACAYGSPKNELLNVGVVAGIGPPAVLTLKHAGMYTMAALSAQKWFPGVMRSSTNWYLRDDKRLQKSISRMSKYLTKEDRAEVTGSDAESMIMAVLKAAYAQGPDGVIRDSQIYSSPWGFELQDIQKGVKLFYGHKDDRTPPVFGRYYKAHIPKAELIEFKDASHFTIHRHDEEIFRKLIGLGLPEKTTVVKVQPTASI